MSEKSDIEWTDSTWNPIRVGPHQWYCEKISPGCDNCYASMFNRRWGANEYPRVGRNERPNVRLDEKALMLPHSWKKPRMVFVCSMTDIAGSWVPDAWLDAIWAVMALAPQHTYQVLSKRPTRLKAYLCDPRAPYRIAQAIDRLQVAEARTLREGGLTQQAIADRLGVSRPLISLIESEQVWPLPIAWPLPNVWVGVSIESDAYTWRANVLRQIPAAVRWISAEPLLGPLPSLNLAGIDWLVTGGESGPRHRDLDLDWVRDLRDRCQENGTAFFHKQSGGRTPKSGGRLLDGREWNEFPPHTSGDHSYALRQVPMLDGSA